MNKKPKMQRPPTNGISETKTDKKIESKETDSIRFVLRTLSVSNRSTHDHIRFRRLTIARVGNEPNMNPKKLDQIRSTNATFGKEIPNVKYESENTQSDSLNERCYKVLQESHNSLPL